MKSLIRNFVFYSIALFLLPILLEGVTIRGGIWTMLFGGFTLTLLFMFIKPLLSVITFPLTVVTLGFFSFLVNVFLVYLLTVFVSGIKIQAFLFSGIEFAGFVIPKMSVSLIVAYLLSAFIIYTVTSLLNWLTR